MELCRENEFCKKFEWIQDKGHASGGWKRSLEQRGWIIIYEETGDCTMYEGSGANDVINNVSNANYCGLVMTKNNCAVSLNGIVSCNFPEAEKDSTYQLVRKWNGLAMENTTLLWNYNCFWDDASEIEIVPAASKSDCQSRCLSTPSCTHVQTEYVNSTTAMTCTLYDNMVEISDVYPAPTNFTSDDTRIGSCSLIPSRNNCTLNSTLGNQYHCYTDKAAENMLKVDYFSFQVNQSENIAYNQTCKLGSNILYYQFGLEESVCKAACESYVDCLAFSFSTFDSDPNYCYLGNALNFTWPDSDGTESKCGVLLDKARIVDNQIEQEPPRDFITYNGNRLFPYEKDGNDTQEIQEYVSLGNMYTSEPYTTFPCFTFEDCINPCKQNDTCGLAQWSGAVCMLSDTISELWILTTNFNYLKIPNCNNCSEYQIIGKQLEFVGQSNASYFSQFSTKVDAFLRYPFKSDPLGPFPPTAPVSGSAGCEFTEPIYTFDQMTLKDCYYSGLGSKLLFSYEYKAYKQTSFCGFFDMLGNSIPRTSESQLYPVKQNYFLNDQLVTYVDGRYEVWSYLWGSKATKYTTIKGPLIDCINYCMENESCIQYAWFTPVSFLFEGDCYSYENAVGISDMVLYKGAVSGWIEGRVECKVEGVNLNCKEPKSINSSHSAATLSTSSTVLSAATTIEIVTHTASTTLITADIAVASASDISLQTNTIENLMAASNFNADQTVSSHIGISTQTVVVIKQNPAYQRSNYEISPYALAILIASIILNAVLLFFLANISRSRVGVKSSSSSRS
ncbi:hypothetical protein HDV01_007465 [Terramyces sp. JEL0728]|nr:hypothetical protein HDV01_007465 [Terramyces sp. JEL0728]